MPKYTNELINETSPYLLQHAHNPVQWKGWNEKTLEEAAESKKLIIVSVGYSACHWCHVMERESFEDENVANLMNKYYVSIKVDREERPDVDQVYMDAAQILTGRGGWPLNVIALPDGRPIYAGTYFTKQQWLKVLQGVQDFYIKTPEKALEQAMQIATGVNKMNYNPEVKESKFKETLLKKAASDWLNAMDNKEGGRAGQMKFPMPGSYLALLRYSVAHKDERALDLTRLTLDKMASGGLYDQLGGGFSRYSVDPLWHVPHFEKMLYDNAQLITLYSEAYKYFKDPYYLQILEETIAFCERELRSEEGGYISAIDADSEGEEGKFYVWTEKEIDEILDAQSALIFKAFYDVKKEGNWEHGKNVLKMSQSPNKLAEDFKLTVDEVGASIKASRDALFLEREERIRPQDDDKLLTSWNALMISGLSHAYEATGSEKYRTLALETANFIISRLMQDGQLQRTYKNGLATINGFLDDYTFTISAFRDLYAITFDINWLNEAERLLKTVLEKFFDETAGFFNFKSSEDTALFVKKQVLEDNVIPAGNSEMANNLFYLGSLLDKADYSELAAKMVLALAPRIEEHAAFYYNWFDLYLTNSTRFSEIAITGQEYESKRHDLSSEFLPNAIILGGDVENLPLLKGKLQKDNTLIYVCKDKACLMPVRDVPGALEQLDDN